MWIIKEGCIKEGCLAYIDIHHMLAMSAMEVGSSMEVGHRHWCRQHVIGKMTAIDVSQIYMSRRSLHSSCGTTNTTTHLVVHHLLKLKFFSRDKPMFAELIKRSLQIADIEQNQGPIPGRDWICPVYAAPFKWMKIFHQLDGTNACNGLISEKQTTLVN